MLIGTSSTVTSQNVQVVSSEDYVEEMIARGPFVQFYFLYIPVNGRGDLGLMVSPQQRDLLRRNVVRMRNTKPIFIIDFWNDGPYVEGCIAAGNACFHVNAYGDVEPCVYTHIATHNVYQSTPREALASALFRGIRGAPTPQPKPPAALHDHRQPPHHAWYHPAVPAAVHASRR